MPKKASKFEGDKAANIYNVFWHKSKGCSNKEMGCSSKTLFQRGIEREREREREKGQTKLEYTEIDISPTISHSIYSEYSDVYAYYFFS